jgi:hypothetical protein
VKALISVNDKISSVTNVYNGGLIDVFIGDAATTFRAKNHLIEWSPENGPDRAQGASRWATRRASTEHEATNSSPGT